MVSLNGFALNGLDQTLFDSIIKCDMTIRHELYANIILSGGSTMFPGLPEPIEKEIVRLAPSTTEVRVIAPPDRKYYAWKSGSILASLDRFPQMLVTHEEYNDDGLRPCQLHVLLNNPPA
jgi:actin beta/gamma 1